MTRLVAVAVLVELEEGDDVGAVHVWAERGGAALPVRLVDVHPDPGAAFTAAELKPFFCECCGMPARACECLGPRS